MNWPGDDIALVLGVILIAWLAGWDFAERRRAEKRREEDSPR